MVDTQLRSRGITDAHVLEAFRLVPRHEFVSPEYIDQAYQDGPLPIGEGQTISQPYMVASMTQAARLRPGEKVLEIGTGSGYQTAILCALKTIVFTIERIAVLSERARFRIEQQRYSAAHFRIGDGTLGWPEEAPFDAILVTAGAPALPEPLGEQLSEGGRLVVPIEDGFSQVLHVFTRRGDSLEKWRGDRCTFVPLIGEHGWKP